MLALTFQRKRVTIALLTAVVLLGAAIRLHDLGKRTMTHIEIYVPGIDLPASLSDPSPRLNLRETLVSMMAYYEPHPPAYYILMLGWTRLLGASIVALRLPSALFGIASLLLIYYLGALENNRTAALLAAAMLAVNGHHVLWSQLAKSLSMACCLGLLSTVLLVLASREGHRPLLIQFLYLGVTLVGLATSHYFWAIFVTHALWILIRSWTRRAVPRLLRLQLIVLALGSPLLALAAFQSRRPSYLSRDLLQGLFYYLQFGFLFEPDSISAPPSRLATLAGAFLVVLALLLLALGLRSSVDQAAEEEVTVEPSFALLLLASGVAFVAILVFARLVSGYDPTRDNLILASALIPMLCPVVDRISQRNWRPLQGPGAGTTGSAVPFQHTMAISSLLAVLPVVLILAISLVIPLFAARGVLLYTPYFIIVLSKGLVALLRRSKFCLVLAAIVAVIHPLSVLHYQHSYHEHPTDYKSLAEQWLPMIEDTDLILVQPHWATTPIFYYLTEDRYRLVGADYSEAIDQHPDSRVWVLFLEGIPPSPEMAKVLEGYDQEKRVDALGIWAVLYHRKPSGY